MSIKAFAVGLAALVLAVPAAAQERGTVELGAFGSVGNFDESLSLDRAYGVGGRVGAFLAPRWSIEAEAGEMKATRPLGLKDVNVGILSTRLLWAPIKAGPLSLLLGVGAGVGTETWFLHSYGVNALGGVKIRVGPAAVLRFAAQRDWLANYDYKAYNRLTMGLSVYRELFRSTRVERIEVPGPPASCEVCVQRPDAVSADEIRRLRDRDAELRALRDSLAQHKAAIEQPASSASARMAMEERIQFEFDKSDLSPAAKAILDEKVEVFRANPTMTIAIIGHTGNIGTDNYNEALGTRRAESAKAYLVSRGIDASRVQIESRGELQPAVSPTAVGMTENAPNRRDMFQLVIVPDVIRKP